MAVRIACTVCHQKLNVAETVLGKKLRCPTCKEVFLATVSAPGEQSVPDEPAENAAPSTSVVAETPAPKPAVSAKPTSPARKPQREEVAAQADVEPAPRRREAARRSHRRDEDDGPPRKGISALGIISLCLGVVGLPLSLFPCISLFSLPIVGLGLLLGIIGFFIAKFGQKSGIGLPLAGSAVCLFGLGVGLTWTVWLTRGVQEAMVKHEQEQTEISEGPAIAVTAVELFKQYEADEAAADRKYKGKVLEVSGKVAEVVEGDKWEGPLVELNTDAEDEDDTIDCEFARDRKKDVTALKPTQMVTIRGKCAGRDSGYVTLQKCILKSSGAIPSNAPPTPTDKVAPLDLTPGGFCLTMNAPVGATVKPNSSGVVVSSKSGFRLRVDPHTPHEQFILDEKRKNLPPTGVDIIEDKEGTLVVGSKILGEESYFCMVKVTVVGKVYSCRGEGEVGTRFSKAQAILMAECARSLQQTASNKQAEMRRDQAVARLQKVNCKVKLDQDTLIIEGADVSDEDMAFVKELPEIVAISIKAEKLTAACLVHLQELPNLRSLDLEGKSVTDAWLAGLKPLRLQYLRLTENKFTAAGLENLKELTKLELLKIRDQPVDDAALQHLAGLPQLWDLNLSNANLSGTGLKHLAGLQKLSSLNLAGNPLTDADLDHLAGAKQLSTLDLNNTKVTKAGVAKLKKSLPSCEISFSAQ